MNGYTTRRSYHHFFPYGLPRECVKLFRIDTLARVSRISLFSEQLFVRIYTIIYLVRPQLTYYDREARMYTVTRNNNKTKTIIKLAESSLYVKRDFLLPWSQLDQIRSWPLEQIIGKLFGLHNLKRTQPVDVISSY